MSYNFVSINSNYNWQALESLLNMPKVWLVVDIDDTLLTPRHYTCSTHWYVTYNRLHKESYDQEELAEHYRPCMQIFGHQPVDPALNKIVANYFPTGKVLAITHRLVDFANETIAHLQEVGVDFAAGKEAEMLKGGQDIFDRAIIYAGYDLSTAHFRHKGELLKEYILSLTEEERPLHILMVEDSKHNLHAVAETMFDMNILFSGHHVPDVARYQEQYTHEHKLCLADYQYSEITAQRNAATDIMLHCGGQCVLHGVYPAEVCDGYEAW